MPQNKRKRGFTLVEMVIAMVVISIVFGMVTMLAVSISGFSKDKVQATDRHEQIMRAQDFMMQWSKTLDSAFNSNYAVVNDSEVQIRCGLYWDKNPNNRFSLKFDAAHHALVADFFVNGEISTKTEELKSVKDVKFTQGSTDKDIGNMVKCQMTFVDDSVYTMILEKETSAPGLSIIFNKPFEKVSGSFNEFTFLTSAEWPADYNATQYQNLQDIKQYAAYDLSAAYQYSALSLMRIQVDDGERMSLESFTTYYGAQWQVRVFNACGKIAYGMKLNSSKFDANAHKIAFFMEDGSILYDGSSVIPMGYVRRPGPIGTQDWHIAANLEYAGESKDSTSDWYWATFDSNIFWDEMDSEKYEHLQYESVRKLYELPAAFGAGIEQGILLSFNEATYPIGALPDDKLNICLVKTADKTVMIQIGMDTSYPLFSNIKSQKLTVSFNTAFQLPDGTPLRDVNSFVRRGNIYGQGLWKKAVTTSSVGEFVSGKNNTSSTDPLDLYKQFTLDFYIYAPWTDLSRTAYTGLENKATAKATYGLTDEFLDNLYDRVFIGRDGVEASLRSYLSTLKPQISLFKETDERMILRFTFNTADLKSSKYPINFATNSFSIRFGNGGSTSSSLSLNAFQLPDGTPVKYTTLARPAAPIGDGPWYNRHTLTPSVTSSTSGSTYLVNITSNGLWEIKAATRYSNILSKANDLPLSFLDSIRDHVYITIDGNRRSVRTLGVNNVDADVYEKNGRWCIQLKIKSSLVNGKNLTIYFDDGFIGPDGNTMTMPTMFVRSGSNSWTGSTVTDVYFPNRTISIQNYSNTFPSMSVELKSGSYSSAAPYYIYGRVKLENAAAMGSGGEAYIVLDYASSADVRLVTLTTDTNGWATFAELYGSNPSIKKENAKISFFMSNMKGTFAVADLIVADKNGNILYSMANDPSIYGIGDLRNVETVSPWRGYNSENNRAGASFPIDTRDSYDPTRSISISVPSGYTGGDASLLISTADFSHGETYTVTGRIRVNVTGKSDAKEAGSHSAAAMVSGFGTTKNYGVPNGSWAALTNADGSALTFKGAEDVPYALTTPHRTIAIHAKHDMTNGKMTIQTDQATAKLGANQPLVVRGFYKVEDFTSVGSGACFEIGDGATRGKITGSSNVTEWTFFRLEWNTNTNLNFEFHNANGYLRLANVTIENQNDVVVYDMATDAELTETYRTSFPWAPSIWYITYFGEPDAMDLSVEAVSPSATPKQYTTTRTETVTKTITTPHRSIAIHAKNNMTNGKMTISMDQFKAKIGSGSYIVRGYYQVDSFTSLASGGCFYIGDGATSGRIVGTANQTTWTYFELRWSPTVNLDFEFYNAMGFLRLANLTIEDASYNRVYDMATDAELSASFHNTFPWNPSIWYITYFGDPLAMDFTAGSATTATPAQYTVTRTETPAQTLSSVYRQIAIHAKNGVTYSRMAIEDDQFKSKIGSGTYTIRGYYQVTDFTTVASGAKYEIGSGASSGAVTGTTNQTSWKYFQLTWSPSNGPLYFSLVNANGYLRLANLTIEDSSYKVVYDMATDSALSAGYHTGFPWNPSIWYITYSGEPDAMDLSISAVSSATPKQYYTTYTETPINTISSSARYIGLGCTNMINAKMLIQSDKAIAKWGSTTLTVRGYYKVPSYTSLGSGNSITIGGNSNKPITVTKAVPNWTYFEFTWNTSKTLSFEFWMASGIIHIGNLTIENSSHTVLYDLAKDSALPSSAYYTDFPRNYDLWYLGYSTNATYPNVDMNVYIDALNSSGSPKQYTVSYPETAYTTLSSAKRTMGIHTNHNLQNGKMVITSSQATAKFGANQTMIVRGYYKVTDYKAVGDNPWWQIGSNASSGASGHKTGNQTSWKYFKLTWNTSKDLNFEFWNCNGYMYLANLTIETTGGAVKYDLSTDSTISSYHTEFPYTGSSGSIWFITDAGGVEFMDMSNTDVKSGSTPKQYSVTITENAKSLSTAKRQIGIHTNHNLQNGKMVITTGQATAKFGANKTLTVRGYYKVTDYKAIGDNPWWQIGSNASSGASGHKTGNQTTWKYFKLTWNTSTDLNFEFWNCNGYMYLANLTIEDASGKIVYDLSTDATISGYQEEFPYTGKDGSIWYITHEADFNFMDMSNSAVTTATPKQYSVTITEHTKSLADGSDARSMGIGTKNGLLNGKMVITSSQATAKFGANKTLIVRGYYKVSSYTKVADGDWYGIGINAASGSIKTTGNQTTWKYFKLTWNTSKDLNFEFYNANGFMYLANLTIEDSSGKIVYDMSTDADLYKDGAYYAGHDEFPRDPSIWYITREADFNFMDMSNSAVKTTATPKQYEVDWDYLKFSMWYATGTLEIADLKITDSRGNVVYDMMTDPMFNSNKTYTNTNGHFVPGSKWLSWEWVDTGRKDFTVKITNHNGPATHAAGEYKVPVFKESAG